MGTADFDSIAGLQLEHEVTAPCDFLGATAIVSTVGALHC